MDTEKPGRVVGKVEVDKAWLRLVCVAAASSASAALPYLHNKLAKIQTIPARK